MYLELCSKYFFISNKKVTGEKHYNVKLFLQVYTFTQCLYKSENTFSLKPQKYICSLCPDLLNLDHSKILTVRCLFYYWCELYKTS